MGTPPVRPPHYLNPDTVWRDEAKNFTPWLAQEKNFQILADVLHFDGVENIEKERRVGDFKADIVAEDRAGLILVENQLYKTDHGHLGKVQTYLAWLDEQQEQSEQVRVVWIAKRFRKEHKNAINWLNRQAKSAGGRILFFAVELEVIQIGDPPVRAEAPATPIFHVVAYPDGWSRHGNEDSPRQTNATMTDSERKFWNFWSGLEQYLHTREISFPMRTISRNYGQEFDVGGTEKSYCCFELTAIGKRDRIGIELFIPDDQNNLILGYFKAQKSEIEQELGEKLDWRQSRNSKRSRIILWHTAIDPMNEENQEANWSWYAEKLGKFYQVFEKRVNDLDVDALYRQHAENNPDDQDAH